ncbi:hypothetical protein EXIGLDRAFT_705740 [Exidia glandulosa HHB12029]|uniref:Uncharacterized protein n=1 Tax=Exidia glandulosa HHB12029 TaxID=1314781 RepID=A0A166AYS6_EXIGL|nr:hypothetical protein EXIGLDRAFT_705740 [Exidia glandulosa HHB12029]
MPRSGSTPPHRTKKRAKRQTHDTNAKRPGQCRYASPFSGVACGKRLSRQEDFPRHIAKVHARKEAEYVRDSHLHISTFDNASDDTYMSMGVPQGAILRRTRRDVDRQLQNFRSATVSTISFALTDQSPLLLHDVGFDVQPGRTSSAMSSEPASANSFSYDSPVVDYRPFEIDYAAFGVPEANSVLAGSSDAGANVIVPLVYSQRLLPSYGEITHQVRTIYVFAAAT